ncbi:MAG: M28 family peptidase [Sneathiella sp.]|nr:M28 family peptidase [Sneathiella sp.]
MKVIREFSGEDVTVVDGNTVTILNRQENNNDVAADYIKQKLSALNNLTINDQSFNTNGRNIIATQLGKTNPNNIYIICAHYDTVADYCADDNASGTAAVLEIARILSTQCFDNTIIYALWDEEENGLNGSGFYATAAAGNGDNILGVINLDMMAYDGDNDDDFDIDVRNIAGSLVLKDGLLSALSTYGFNLNVNVVDPGTTASDHGSFWNNGFPAVLVGESWFNGDQTPNYHTAADRFSTLDMPYYKEMTKLVLAYMVTIGSLVNVDNTVSTTSTTLTANQTGAAYQWLDCDNGNAAIPSETNQSFVPASNGNYAVQITSGTCIEISNCVSFNLLNTLEFNKKSVQVYPNPVSSILNIDLQNANLTVLKIVTLDGKELLSQSLEKLHNEINLSQFSNGVYFVNLENGGNTVSFKIVKE